LSAHGLAFGDDVWTFGFPHTQVGTMEDGRLSFRLEGRYLQGYVTRGFIHDPPGFRPTPSYELDMPAPAGLSGAPLFKLRTLEVVGMVYGANETGSIVQMAEEDPKTGERIPYVERILAFGLAHQEFTLHGIQGPATGDRRLGEMLRRDG
jgi:hypothetical protein